jgi:hypothetical protein
VKVNLCEGLLQIGSRAFCYCTSLNYLTIPSTVNRIGFEAFKGCEHLLDVKICDGLEQIGEWAFRGCKSLKRISFSSTVKRIGVGAFRGCDRLVEVELGEGLEYIDAYAFKGCKSLRRIRILSTVKLIGEQAFGGCSQLVEVDFYEAELYEGQDKLVEWKSNAFDGCKSLNRIYIPSALIGVRKWRIEIEQMMEGYDCSKHGARFHNIHSKILTYAHEFQRLKNAMCSLELVIWKSKVDESLARTADMKMQCRINCGAEVIIRNVLPYLIANEMDSDEGNDVDECSSIWTGDGPYGNNTPLLDESDATSVRSWWSINTESGEGNDVDESNCERGVPDG